MTSKTGDVLTPPVLAWHFVGDMLRDGRPVPADGDWLVHDGPLKLCESGLHASLDPFDALVYAPGPVLCRVELAGAMVRDHDKVVAARRRILARRDATDTLRSFARACARDVLHFWDAPAVVQRYLETGDDTIQAAASAAARAAASDAAWAATRAAAWAASAAASDASDAARAVQRPRWAQMVETLFATEPVV